MRVMNLAVFSSLLLAGCSEWASQQASTIDNAAAVDVQVLKDQIAALSQRLDAIDPTATLKLSDSGYSVVPSDFGGVTMQWIKSSKEGAGTKVVFKVGNPHTATLTEVTIHPILRGPDGEPLTGPASFSLKGQASPGTWSEMSGTVDSVPPEKIASIDIVGLEIERIALRNQ